MGICLVAYVEDDLVLRSVVDIVESDNQFYRSETRSQMAGIDSTAFYHIVTDLLTEFLQLLDGECLDVCRGVDLVEIYVCRVVHCGAV